MDTRIDLHRFDDQIAVIEAELRTAMPEPGGVLLYGSSTMANWRANDWCYRQLAPLPVSNTGFGGATAEETLYYYHRLVAPLRPSMMVYYEGANDLMNGYTPEEVIEMTHRLFEWCRQDFPGILFAVMPIKLSPALDHIRTEGELCNTLFQAYADAHEDTHMLDVKALIYHADGSLRRDVYVDDMLHHTEQGYKELAELILPELKRLYSLRTGVDHV